MGWKEDFQSFDRFDEDDEDKKLLRIMAIERSAGVIRITNKSKSKKVNAKKLQETVRQMAIRYARAQKKLQLQTQRAQAIVKIEPHRINPTSLSSLIFQVLSNAKIPQHITDIITMLEANGWKSNTIYHKYNQVQQALSDCYYLFEKTDVGTYQIRTAFRNEKPDKPEPKVWNPNSIKTPTLVDIVENIVKNYSQENNLKASDVHYLTYCSGVPCSYTAVHRALQDKRFERNGIWYIPK